MRESSWSLHRSQNPKLIQCRFKRESSSTDFNVVESIRIKTDPLQVYDRAQNYGFQLYKKQPYYRRTHRREFNSQQIQQDSGLKAPDVIEMIKKISDKPILDSNQKITPVQKPKLHTEPIPTRFNKISTSKAFNLDMQLTKIFGELQLSRRQNTLQVNQSKISITSSKLGSPKSLLSKNTVIQNLFKSTDSQAELKDTIKETPRTRFSQLLTTIRFPTMTGQQQSIIEVKGEGGGGTEQKYPFTRTKTEAFQIKKHSQIQS